VWKTLNTVLVFEHPLIPLSLPQPLVKPHPQTNGQRDCFTLGTTWIRKLVSLQPSVVAEL